MLCCHNQYYGNAYDKTQPWNTTQQQLNCSTFPCTSCSWRSGGKDEKPLLCDSMVAFVMSHLAAALQGCPICCANILTWQLWESWGKE